MWSQRASTAAADLAPQPASPGKPVGTVADERQIVGDGAGPDAELGDDAGLVDQHVLAPVELHDAGPAHALAQVLVRACR